MQTLVRKSHLHLAPDHDTTLDFHTLGTAYTLTRPHAPTHILSHQRTHTSTGEHNQRTNTFHHPYTHKQAHPQTPAVEQSRAHTFSLPQPHTHTYTHAYPRSEHSHGIAQHTHAQVRSARGHVREGRPEAQRKACGPEGGFGLVGRLGRVGLSARGCQVVTHAEGVSPAGVTGRSGRGGFRAGASDASC